MQLYQLNVLIYASSQAIKYIIYNESQASAKGSAPCPIPAGQSCAELVHEHAMEMNAFDM